MYGREGTEGEPRGEELVLVAREKRERRARSRKGEKRKEKKGNRLQKKKRMS